MMSLQAPADAIITTGDAQAEVEDQAKEAGSEVEVENEDLRTTADDMKCATRAFHQCKRMKLPDGPASLQELFRWPARNVEKLLQMCPDAETHIANAKRIMKYDFELHESYSGLGTVGICLHQQHRQFHRICHPQQGTRFQNSWCW